MASVVAAWPMVALAEVLALDVDAVPVDATATYPIAGVYSFGRGLLARAPLAGTETTYKVFHRLHTDQFVLSQLKAWEGALARVPTDFDGWFLSPQFPTFRANGSRLDIKFFEWYCKQRHVWEQLRSGARGMGARRDSVSPKQLLSLRIPLPPLDEQRRIVARIEELAARIEKAKRIRREARAQVDALIPGVLERLAPSGANSVLGDFVTLQHGYAFESHWFSDHGIRLVRNVNIGHGSICWDDVALLPEEHQRPEFQRFELHAGDILLSLNRPVISTGVKVVRVKPEDIPSLLVQRVGRVQFQRDGVLPEFLFEWFNSPQFVAALSTRLHGVPYIASKDVERLPFAPPSIDEQRRFVGHVHELRTRVSELCEIQSLTTALLDALLPSVLDKAFRGEL